MSSTNPFTTRRTWLRFGLRTLLVLLTLSCIWLAIVFNQCRRQRRAVEAIERAGGVVGFDYQLDAGKEDVPSPGPPWLRRIVGDELFRRPVHVEIRGEGIDDAFLAEHLSGVRTAEFISVDSELMTDASMSAIAGLRQADMVTIVSPQVTDRGLASLQSMDRIEALYLECPNLTDAGMAHISKLSKLESLTLDCPRITPDGIRQLKGLRNVQYFRSLRDEQNRDALTALRSPAMNEFYNVPIVDALEVIATQHGLAINTDAVPAEFHRRTITFADRTISYDQLLELMLTPANLGIVLDRGALKITTKEEAEAGRAGYRAACKAFPGAERVDVDW